MNDKRRVINLNFESRSVVYLVLVIALFSAACRILSPFIAPLVWAAVVVACSWPLYTRLSSRFPPGSYLPPVLSTMFLSLIVAGICIPLMLRVAAEGMAVAKAATPYLADPQLLEERLFQVPVLNRAVVLLPSLKELDLQEAAKSSHNQILSLATRALRNTVESVFSFFIFLLCTFFLFKDGHDLGEQLTHAAQKLGGIAPDLLGTVGVTVKATVYGALLTALVQAILAAVGFIIFGAPVPLFLGALTFLLAFVPFGPPLLYIPIGIWMFLGNGPYRGVGLIVWSVMTVSAADNIIKPLVVSHLVNMPLLLALFGVLGGLIAFGLIGLFVGPVILGLCRALWLEFIRRSSTETLPAET